MFYVVFDDMGDVVYVDWYGWVVYGGDFIVVFD